MPNFCRHIIQIFGFCFVFLVEQNFNHIYFTCSSLIVASRAAGGEGNCYIREDNGSRRVVAQGVWVCCIWNPLGRWSLPFNCQTRIHFHKLALKLMLSCLFRWPWNQRSMWEERCWRNIKSDSTAMWRHHTECSGKKTSLHRQALSHFWTLEIIPTYSLVRLEAVCIWTDAQGFGHGPQTHKTTKSNGSQEQGWHRYLTILCCFNFLRSSRLRQDLFSGLFLLSPVAQTPTALHFSLPAKRPYTMVEQQENEPHLNSKQRKYLKFQKRFQRKSGKS